MSTTRIEVVEIGSVVPHPNADRLEIATVFGTTVVVGKGTFKAGDMAVYFPPNMLIPDKWADKLGVAKYLKHAEYEPGQGSSQCRVAGCRLRGEPSFGFLAAINQGSANVGDDVTEMYGGKKYEPPVKVSAADAAPEDVLFHRYTDIENYARYPNLIPPGTMVRITEKIHGSNCRVGLVLTDSGWEFMAGSHRVRRKRPTDGRLCPYWEPMKYMSSILAATVGTALTEMRRRIDAKAVVFFGEIFGPGVQDLDYGVASGQRRFRIFDATVNGAYVSWDELSGLVESFSEDYPVETVPLLYEGPFDPNLIAQYTYGDSVVGASRTFKGREGIVITPLEETVTPRGQRMILKSISADYLDRKGAADNE